MSLLGALGGEALGGIVKTVGDVIDDLHTSDEERAAGELEVRRLDQQLMVGQQEINKEEAKHSSLLVAGWRPAAGWVCVQALWFAFVPKAIILSAIWGYAAVKLVAGWDGAGAPPVLPDYPDLGVTDLLGMLFALLGLGGMRTAETLAGKARSEPLAPFKLPNPFRRPASAAQQEAP